VDPGAELDALTATGSSATPPATVAGLAERELIERIARRLPPAPGWLLVGIGDDAAVVEPERNRVEVLTVDALVEGVHFDRAFVPPDAIGYRALAVNLSDLAAMGAAPRLALLSIALPPALPLADFDGVIDGLARLAGNERLHVAGGNLTRSPGPLLIDVTMIGTLKRRQALTRGGASPGDVIYVSGTVGTAAAGLQMLRTSHARGGGTLPAIAGVCIDRYLHPEPRVRLGTLLARNRAVSAAIDLSDGLADGVHRIAEASGVGATIDAEALPIEPAARAWFEARGLDPVNEAICGGDDYELLVTVPSRLGRRLAAAVGTREPGLTRIGVCTKERGAVLLRTAAGERALPPAAFGHFR
jgi:thiamine-monophosphate kinase